MGSFNTQNHIQTGATDYSYNIGPTNYKTSVAPRNVQKFSDLKFHNTAMDFNKAVTQSTIGSYTKPVHTTGVKKTNNSVDLGSKHPGYVQKPV